LLSHFSTISTNNVILGTAGFLIGRNVTVNALSTTSLSTVTFFADSLTVARTVASTISSGVIITNSTITSFLSTGLMDIQFLSTRAVFVSSINGAPSGTTNTATNFTASNVTITQFVTSQSSIIQSTFTSSLLVTGTSVFSQSISLFNDFIIYATPQQTLPVSIDGSSTTIIATASTLAFNRTLFFDRSSFRVGINQSTPQYDLDVNGDIEQTSAIALKPSGTDWNEPSDRRIKTNIQLANIDMCYSTVKDINLYRYNFIDTYRADSDSNVLGFLAQNVQTYFPKAVQPIKDRYFEDLLKLNTSQIFRTHYGATQKLGQLIESNDVRLSSATQPLYLTENTVQFVSNGIATQSTTFVTFYTETVSTLAGNNLQLQSLADTYESLVSQVSSLLI
jgi:hypothetical protein